MYEAFFFFLLCFLYEALERCWDLGSRMCSILKSFVNLFARPVWSLGRNPLVGIHISRIPIGAAQLGDQGLGQTIHQTVCEFLFVLFGTLTYRVFQLFLVWQKVESLVHCRLCGVISLFFRCKVLHWWFHRFDHWWWTSRLGWCLFAEDRWERYGDAWCMVVPQILISSAKQMGKVWEEGRTHGLFAFTNSLSWMLLYSLTGCVLQRAMQM